ncbi:NACHT domain-containing protein [Actinoallomurus sp. CA-150999]|uniref:NACHT domain-containing protein n=1 Tax=Actinoallomurus sp. CA-150999 TaxID=3239887 RepID=UPI003D947ED6
MARSLSYSDAVKLLGGRGKAVKALDTLTGGALLAATAGGTQFVLSLFDAKAEMAKVGGELVAGLAEKISGLGRFDRTQRLEAAHAVIVLTAYFEAIAECGLPDLDLDRAEQLAVATRGSAGSNPRLSSVTRHLLRTQVPSVGPHRPDERELEAYYLALSESLGQFVTGLAIWDDLDGTRQARIVRALREDVPAHAIRRHDEMLRRLAADFPEVAFWINLGEHSVTRATLRSGLTELEHVLARIASDRAPDGRREELACRYRAELSRGVLRTGDVPPGLIIPALEDAYIDHQFRAADLSPFSRPDHQDWWADIPVRDDLYGYLLGYLTSLKAVRGPLLLLGQPGSGKSVLTKVLAARLPASDFLVVRVSLRETPADSDLQGQIEYAIRDATGETLSWPALARTADGALPVVLLDGYDELLQATGVSQSDYLERIVQFQEREADQGRPVAVVVTSRTTVADRVRVPPDGVVVLHLEPFHPGQVERWLKVWNEANEPFFETRGLLPLPVTSALAHATLAEQPLLLMMLALYDADDNALQRDDDNLDQAQLYERLLNRFAEREVAKSSANLDSQDFARAVEEDLLHLSLTAFSMFNRRRQWITEDELNTDLASLLKEAGPVSGIHSPLSPAQRVVGKFFFVHQSQAVRAETRLTTCEFLHATFGEFLVARLVVRELAELARDAEHAARRTRQANSDDGFLRVLLSFVPISARSSITYFIAALCHELPKRGLIRQLLQEHFGAALAPQRESAYGSYAPAQSPMPARYAAYSVNLVLLIALLGPLRASDLFPGSPDPVNDWRRHTLLWRSQLSDDEFRSLTLCFIPRRVKRGASRDLILSPVQPFARIDPTWAYDDLPTLDTFRMANVGAYADTALLCDELTDLLLHASEPLENLTEVFHRRPDGSYASAAHELTELIRVTVEDEAPESLTAHYDACLDAITIDDPDSPLYLRMIFRQLALDAERLPRNWLALIERRFQDEIQGDQQLGELARRAFTAHGEGQPA